MTTQAISTDPSAKTGRSEHDRLNQGGFLKRLIRRPEVGAFAVMVLVIVSIWFASDGNAFNALGLKSVLPGCQ